MITITRQPYLYAPSQNAMIWEFTCDNNNTLYYNVLVKKAVTNEILIKTTIYLPPSSNKSFIDIQAIIDAQTSTPIDNSDNVLVNLDGVISYYLEITGIDNAGNITEPKLTTGINHAFNGKLNNFDLFNNLMNSYFLQKGYEHKFLSDRPTFSFLHYVQKEHLYFLADNTSDVGNITFFLTYKNGTEQTHMMDFTNPQNKKLHRLNLSPRSLSEQIGFDLQNLKTITVYIADNDGVQMSEDRTYNLMVYNCNQTLCNINWINEFGGMTSNTFISPRETKSSTKNVINTNGYLNRINGVYQPFQKVVNTSIANRYIITSQVLSDEEYDAFSSIINSRNVYTELNSGELYPIVLDTNNIDVLKKKYTKTRNRMNLEFTSNANLKLELFLVPAEIVSEGFDYNLDFFL